MKFLSLSQTFRLILLLSLLSFTACDYWEDDYEEPDTPDLPSLISSYNGSISQTANSGSLYHGAGQRFNHFYIQYIGNDVYEIVDARNYRIRFNFTLDASANLYYATNFQFTSGIGQAYTPPGNAGPFELFVYANGEVSGIKFYYKDGNNDIITLNGMRDNRVSVPATTHQFIIGNYFKDKPGCAGRTLQYFYFFADGTAYFRDPNRCVAPDCYYHDYYYWSVVSPGTLVIEQTARTECGVIKSFTPIQEYIYVTDDGQGNLVMDRSGDVETWSR